MLYKTALLLLAVAVMLAGCGEGGKNPVEEYGDTMVDSLDRAETAALKMNLTTVKAAIDRYYARHGSYPERLDDLSLHNISTDMYLYDPDTGEITIDREKK